ncbi:Prefoldin [Fimicolochytrium jonesii]|uniref:Prefoldin n=1 Tax=Fimicolochytrium jonesii TaxID=1396493 RepID=UPI0022FDF1D7|nr:Prefoldin [Fimicolochytrium jonesii]KAI8827120.1 Prefoldin [Fimicolochytrium jonesii]
MMAGAQLEKEMAAFQNLQRDFSKVIESRTQLESQLKENEMVAKEFSLLKPDATIYKLIGPVLVKQEQGEAVTNVKKRVEYITGEIKRLEGQIKDLDKKQEAKKAEVIQLQQAYQQQMQANA